MQNLICLSLLILTISLLWHKSEHTILTNLDSAWWFLIPVPLGVVVVLVADFVLSDPLQGVGPAQGDHALHNGHVVEGHLDVLPIPVCLGSPAPWNVTQFVIKESTTFTLPEHHYIHLNLTSLWQFPVKLMCPWSILYTSRINVFFFCIYDFFLKYIIKS